MKKILPVLLITPMLISACCTRRLEAKYDTAAVETMETVEVAQQGLPNQVIQPLPPIVEKVQNITEIHTEKVQTELYVGFNRDAELIAKTLYGECRGIESDMEKAAVAWTILNRVDDPRFPNTVEAVVSQPYQFIGFSYKHPVLDELLELSKDVITRWYTKGEGRVLPQEYLFFYGDGERNHFRLEWKGTDFWDWSLPSPYEGG